MIQPAKRVAEFTADGSGAGDDVWIVVGVNLAGTRLVREVGLRSKAAWYTEPTT